MTNPAEMSLERVQELLALRKTMPWIPASKPQVELLNTEADEVLFGGSAGGGKSDALLGYALLRSRNALLLRREFRQIQSLQDRLNEIMGGKDHYKAGEQTWTFPDGRRLELGSCPNLGDEQKFQGRARDCLLVDEGAHFLAEQIDFLTGWLRDASGRPCRLIVASNPPLSGTGVWLLDRWRPWLDPSYPNPAQPGELRWFARVNDRMEEVPAGTKGAISRVFIPSKLADNPYLRETSYRDRLEALPGEMRAALLDGDFFAGAKSDPLQAIPNEWIRAAQARWTPDCDLPITCVGIDPARGGRDRCVVVIKRRHWISRPIILTPEQCRTGGAVAARVLAEIGDQWEPRVNVDVIGVGSSVVDHLQPYLGHRVIPVASNASPTARARAGQYSNLRAEMWWSLRMRLDPAHSSLQLPPDPVVYSELAAPRYSVNARGIQVEAKESLIKRVGRSIDVGDAIVLACSP